MLPFYFLFTVCPNFPLTSPDKTKTKFWKKFKTKREREQWEMYYGISHFNRKVNFLSYLAHFLPSPIIFVKHNSALLLFIYCLSELSFDISWQKEDKVWKKYKTRKSEQWDAWCNTKFLRNFQHLQQNLTFKFIL